MINKESKNLETLDFTGSKLSLTNPKKMLSTVPGLVRPYQPGGHKHYYYRYSYRDGSKVRHIHIKGGQVTNNRAITLC